MRPAQRGPHVVRVVQDEANLSAGCHGEEIRKG